MQRQERRKQFLLKIFHKGFVGERMVTKNNLLQKVKDVLAPITGSFPIEFKTLLFLNIQNGSIYRCSDAGDLQHNWIQRYGLTTVYCYVMNSKQQINNFKQFGSFIDQTTNTISAGQQQRYQKQFDTSTSQAKSSQMQLSSTKKQAQKVYYDATEEQQAVQAYQTKGFQVKPIVAQRPITDQQYLNSKPTRPISMAKGKMLNSPSQPAYLTKDPRVIQHNPKPIIARPGKQLEPTSNHHLFDRVATAPSNNVPRGYQKELSNLGMEGNQFATLSIEGFKQEIQNMQPKIEYKRAMQPKTPLKINEPIRPPSNDYSSQPPPPAVQPEKTPKTTSNPYTNPISYRPSSVQHPPRSYRR